MKRFYITTPIYYVTAKPHLGSLYSTLIADVIARYERLQGRDPFFVTGTDEHGQKVSQAAANAGMAPQEFVDSFIPAYKECWQKYGIAYDRFIRTTEPAHIQGAQALVTKLIDAGHIYKANYEGWYCTQCEMFVTEKELTDGKAPKCPNCGRDTIWLSEDTYYFKLSAFQEPLLKLYEEHPDFIMPKERLHEVISFVAGGLKDLSISRTTVPWGIPFPHDKRHTIYVWVEALSNYLTAVGYGDREGMTKFADYWPADLQVLGKDIIRFHAVYWPALLMAVGLPLPKKLLVHGWITVDHQKMSKSLGNVVDPLALQTQYGTDPVRYYLMRHMPITHDGNFSNADLEQTITADLAHTLGNLFNRASVLAQTVSQGAIIMPEEFAPASRAVVDKLATTISEYTHHFDMGMIHMALASVQQYLHSLNQYFHAHEPWKLAKTNPEACREVLASIARGLHGAAVLLSPIMPQTMTKLLHGLGVDTTDATVMSLTNITSTRYLYAAMPPLFIKPEPALKEQPVNNEKLEQTNTDAMPVITIEEFTKVRLAVGTITEAMAVEKSDKLIKLTVNFGEHGTRQILTGLRQHHAPATLAQTQAVFVLNLKPRMMMGLESHGMLLTAADAHGVPQPVRAVAHVPDGTILK